MDIFKIFKTSSNECHCVFKYPHDMGEEWEKTLPEETTHVKIFISGKSFENMENPTFEEVEEKILDLSIIHPHKMVWAQPVEIRA